MPPIENPLDRISGKAIETTFKWFVGISVSGIFGGGIGLAALFGLFQSAPENLRNFSPHGPAPFNVLMPVLWVAIALFATTFAIAAFIFLKVFCGCSHECGCIAQPPPIPSLPTPPPVSLPKPEDVKAVLNELKGLLDRAKHDLETAVMTWNLAAAADARSRIIELERRIREIGGTP